MTIGIACDHAAYNEKKLLIDNLKSKGYDMIDYGCNSIESVDYPDFAHSLSNGLYNKDFDFGVLLCGSGIGISIAANKNKGVRAALCCTDFHAEMSRKHNDANVIAFGSRATTIDEMKKMIDIFLNTKFEGARHLDRVNKIEK